mmetsp:Transcript_7129/g.17720  ORF Transcript_7129/g.17720 Transcript_7129/m.17720 type:complete len:139 (+) Transcript_7129:1702-2118(+)
MQCLFSLTMSNPNKFQGELACLLQLADRVKNNENKQSYPSQEKSNNESAKSDKIEIVGDHSNEFQKRDFSSSNHGHADGPLSKKSRYNDGFNCQPRTKQRQLLRTPMKKCQSIGEAVGVSYNQLQETIALSLQHRRGD